MALAFVGAALPVREEDHGDGDGGSDPRWRSRVVLLDDPTGDCADPATRRATWAMLRAPRAAAPTTVVLVTRSVAEASAVADRIAVMSHGRVKCCGGLTFLRKLYGLGYRLHVTLADGDGDEDGDGDADGDDDGDGDADAQADTLARDRTLALLDAVRRRVPEAEIARDPSSKDSAFRVSRDASTSSISSRSVVVSLADHAGRIGALLADLESNADRLGVRDVALEATSLEERLRVWEKNRRASGVGSRSRRRRRRRRYSRRRTPSRGRTRRRSVRVRVRHVARGRTIFVRSRRVRRSKAARVFYISRPGGARRPGSFAALHLTPAVVALALCALQVASSARSSAVSESFLARATWLPPAAASANGVGARCAGSRSRIAATPSSEPPASARWFP